MIWRDIRLRAFLDQAQRARLSNPPGVVVPMMCLEEIVQPRDLAHKNFPSVESAPESTLGVRMRVIGRWPHHGPKVMWQSMEATSGRIWRLGSVQATWLERQRREGILVGTRASCVATFLKPEGVKRIWSLSQTALRDVKDFDFC